MEIRLITAPAVEPVSLADAQLHLRAPTSGADATLISAYIQAARETVEAHTGRALVTQTWQARLSAFPATGAVYLPRAPLIAVTTLAIVDAAGAVTTVAADQYQVDASTGPYAQPGAVLPASGVDWPETRADTLGAVRVTFTAGYGATAASVPAALRAAILLIVGELYEQREASAEKPTSDTAAIRRLMDPFRIWGI